MTKRITRILKILNIFEKMKIHSYKRYCVVANIVIILLFCNFIYSITEERCKEIYVQCEEKYGESTSQTLDYMRDMDLDVCHDGDAYYEDLFIKAYKNLYEIAKHNYDDNVYSYSEYIYELKKLEAEDTKECYYTYQNDDNININSEENFALLTYHMEEKMQSIEGKKIAQTTNGINAGNNTSASGNAEAVDDTSKQQEIISSLKYNNQIMLIDKFFSKEQISEIKDILFSNVVTDKYNLTDYCCYCRVEGYFAKDFVIPKKLVLLNIDYLDSGNYEIIAEFEADSKTVEAAKAEVSQGLVEISDIYGDTLCKFKAIIHDEAVSDVEKWAIKEVKKLIENSSEENENDKLKYAEPYIYINESSDGIIEYSEICLVLLMAVKELKEVYILSGVVFIILISCFNILSGLRNRKIEQVYSANEKNIKELKNVLEKSSNNIKEFCTTMSAGNTELGNALSDRVNMELEHINNTVNFLEKMQSDKYSMGYVKLKRENLEKIVKGEVSKFNSIIGEENISIIIEAKDKPVIKTDEELMKQVISNIMINVMCMKPENSPFKIRLNETELYYRVGFEYQAESYDAKNSGESWNTVFVDSKDKEGYPRTLPGLWISKRILELLDSDYGTSKGKNTVEVWFECDR